MNIGIWGDSIVYGQCDSEALGWVGRLRKSFGSNNKSHVYNFGVCGDTTEDLLKRFSIEVDSVKPNTMVFAIGINDSRYLAGEDQNNVPLEKYKQNMQELIKLAKGHTDAIYIIGATKTDETVVRKGGSRFVNSIIKIYNDFLKEFSESEQVTYVDVFDSIDIEADLADGLHPNAQGYEKLYQVIEGAILKA